MKDWRNPTGVSLYVGVRKLKCKEVRQFVKVQMANK